MRASRPWFSISTRCPTSVLTNTAVTDEGITALVQYCHTLSSVLLTNTAVTDAGIRALVKYCHSLFNILLTNTCD